MASSRREERMGLLFKGDDDFLLAQSGPAPRTDLPTIFYLPAQSEKAAASKVMAH